jgi:hypothetical protein
VSDSSRPSTREQREFNVKAFGGAIGGSIVLLMVALVAQSQSMPNHSGILFTDLTIVFALFVVSILVVGVLYQYLYKTDALQFFFNEAITQRQKENCSIQINPRIGPPSAEDCSNERTVGSPGRKESNRS